MYNFSKEKMGEHYNRWNYAEQRIQAWTSITDYKQIMQTMTSAGTGATLLPPEPVSVIVPTAMLPSMLRRHLSRQVLLGRKPVFPLMATRGTETERARLMELALQSNLDASRGQETLWQFACWDPLVYGFGSAKNMWEERSGQTIRWIAGQREMATETTFAGNVLSAIDPYAFKPDPRVPIHECNVRGDFMFCDSLSSESILKDLRRTGC
jgi:hypothetical protein